MPSSIYSALVVSGGCCRMSSPLGVPSTITFEVGKLQLHGTIYEKVRIAARREVCPSAVIMDGNRPMLS
jgi:hypothetical protein